MRLDCHSPPLLCDVNVCDYCMSEACFFDVVLEVR